MRYRRARGQRDSNLALRPKAVYRLADNHHAGSHYGSGLSFHKGFRTERLYRGVKLDHASARVPEIDALVLFERSGRVEATNAGDIELLVRGRHRMAHNARPLIGVEQPNRGHRRPAGKGVAGGVADGHAPSEVRRDR